MPTYTRGQVNAVQKLNELAVNIQQLASGWLEIEQATLTKLQSRHPSMSNLLAAYHCRIAYFYATDHQWHRAIERFNTAFQFLSQASLAEMSAEHFLFFAQANFTQGLIYFFHSRDYQQAIQSFENAITLIEQAPINQRTREINFYLLSYLAASGLLRVQTRQITFDNFIDIIDQFTNYYFPSLRALDLNNEVVYSDEFNKSLHVFRQLKEPVVSYCLLTGFSVSQPVARVFDSENQADFNFSH